MGFSDPKTDDKLYGFGQLCKLTCRQYRTADWKKAIVTIATEIKPLSYKGKGGKEVKASKKYKDSIEEFMGA